MVNVMFRLKKAGSMPNAACEANWDWQLSEWMLMPDAVTGSSSDRCFAMSLYAAALDAADAVSNLQGMSGVCITGMQTLRKRRCLAREMRLWSWCRSGWRTRS